jgi:hypothetical protein
MTSINKVSLDKLLPKCAKVTITEGRLIITPRSGKDVPSDWLSEHELSLITEIANMLNINIYNYIGYSTGRYGKHLSEGVCMQFDNLLNGDEAFAILNVQLTRKRTTKHGAVGSDLPVGQFHVGKKHSFYKFWVSANIKLPARLSSFHDYMGKLKGLVFTGEIGLKNKIRNKTLTPLNVSHAQIIAPNCHPMTNKDQTMSRQVPYNYQTKMPDKKMIKGHAANDIQSNTNACVNNHGTGIQGNAVIGNPLSLVSSDPKRPEDQTCEEWLQDYENALAAMD